MTSHDHSTNADSAAREGNGDQTAADDTGEPVGGNDAGQRTSRERVQRGGEQDTDALGNADGAS